LGCLSPILKPLLEWAKAIGEAIDNMRVKACAYCGSLAEQLDLEHVIPRCLYPSSKAKSKVQRLTVPACNQCNNGWSDDEAHFRNILLISGEPNQPVRDLWKTTALRSFEKVDGPRRLDDLFRQMKPVSTSAGNRHMVYPAQDERFMRVIRKIVRGLCHYHNVLSPVPDSRVSADVLKYIVPQEFLDEMSPYHREQDIFEYRFQVLNEPEIHSVWLLTFFERRKFIAWVSGPGDSLEDV